jgi:single-stranded-DNA-specific exonuclease
VKLIEQEAIAWCLETQFNPQRRVLVIVQPGWHHGVIGIVASRLVERYGVPVFIGTYESEGESEGEGEKAKTASEIASEIAGEAETAIIPAGAKIRGSARICSTGMAAIGRQAALPLRLKIWSRCGCG